MQLITARTPAHYAAAVSLFKEYATGLGIDLQFQNFDQELETLPQKYGPPTGELWLIEDNGVFVGCAAIYQMTPGTCELKRMYIREAYRGQKWGEKLLQTALETAKNLGYQTMRLDSLRRLTPAILLYQRSGFQEIDPYNFNPEPDVVYFEKQL
jgi:putative acetyltransferase